MTAQKPVPSVSIAVATLLRRMLTEQPDKGARYSFPPGRGGSRVANKAVELDLAKMYDKGGKQVLRGGDTLTLVVDRARAALAAYDARRVPADVEVTTDLRVLHKTRLLGKLSRSGASTGQAVRWTAYNANGGDLGTFPGDRVAAVRAICKYAGIHVPGADDTAPPEAA